MLERDVLSNIRKKAPAERQGHQGRERLIKQPWLQLMYCALVSSRKVGCVFWSDGSRQDRGLKESSKGVGVDKMRLGLDDVNLQTQELHYNYSVLIGSAE